MKLFTTQLDLMKMTKNKIMMPTIALGWFIFLAGCGSDDATTETTTELPTETSDYVGTGAVTQGLGMTTTENLYPNGQRVSPVGTVTDADGTVWTVPADVNYTNSAFPFAPDLSNPDGAQYSSAAEALEAFDSNNIIEVDADGELITAYIFGDNYFELYVNGTEVGKDAIPFTPFNSHILKFRVAAPYTVAMLLVDWEENLGLGSESQATDYHPGDGGVVAVFHDANGSIIATTGSDWKAQTFYISPISDLTCPVEMGTTRSSANCSTADATDGSQYYALHWEIPSNWMDEDFDDADWPDASTYTNETIGVDNKSSYTNFTDIFDDASNDAQFIWSTNVVLDNEVILRKTIQ